jgi:hypothetical protein
MYNREKERQNGHNKSEKKTCFERGNKHHFQKEGGGDIVFGPKYMTPDMSRKKSANTHPMAGVSYIPVSK